MIYSSMSGFLYFLFSFVLHPCLESSHKKKSKEKKNPFLLKYEGNFECHYVVYIVE